MTVPPSTIPSYRPGHRTLGLALSALLPLLAGCGGTEEDKAASTVARGLEAFGLHGVSWGRARVDGGSLVLLDAKGSLDGVGPVRASEIAVTGFTQVESGWRADSIRADVVDGSLRARRISLRAPVATKDGKGWSTRDEGRVLEAYEGPLAGMLVSLRSASVGPAPRIPGRPDGTQAGASGLRLPEGAPGPLAAIAGLDWEVSIRTEAGRTGAVLVEVQRAEAKGWSVTGRIEFAGGPGVAEALARIEPAAILDARRWPEGIQLREADLDMTLARPQAFLGASAPDPVAGSMAAKVAAGGLASWHVRMQPRQPVPVREIPGILASTGADARLGLAAQVRDIVMPSRTGTPQKVGPQDRPSR